MKTVSVMFSVMLVCASVQPVLAADTARYKEQFLYSFCSQANCADGASPLAGVIDMMGALYGTTGLGGNASCDNGLGCGVVFSLNPKTGGENVLYAFCSQQNCADGAYPQAGLIAINGILFGTTSGGGNTSCSTGCGTVFSVDPATGAEKVLYTFCSQQNCTDGARPFASLIAAKGMLYGTTFSGGSMSCNDGCGTVFSLDPATGAEKVVYSFCKLQSCANGSFPYASLIDVKGKLYGTTVGGGNYSSCSHGAGCGTVFFLDPNTGAETVLHSFGNDTDGKSPQAGLIAVDGVLFGTTFGGGNGGCAENVGCGTVFSVDPSNGAEAVLYAFCSQQNCGDGSNPDGDVVAVNGALYGTADTGGDSGCGGNLGCGIIFSVDPGAKTEKVLHTFGNDTDGQMPEAGLIKVMGTLYGTTAAGGANGYGTVFALKKR